MNKRNKIYKDLHKATPVVRPPTEPVSDGIGKSVPKSYILGVHGTSIFLTPLKSSVILLIRIKHLDFVYI